MAGAVEPAPRRSRAVGVRQIGQMLQQRVQQLAALEPVAGADRARPAARRPRAPGPAPPPPAGSAPAAGAQRFRRRRRRTPVRRAAEPFRQGARAPLPRSGRRRHRGPLRRCHAPRLAVPRGERHGLGRQRLEAARHQAVPARVRQRRAASASRTPPAGPRRGSARHRAAGCAPPCAGARASSRMRCAASAAELLARREQIGTATPVAGSSAQMIGPSSGGIAVVSGRMTSGACRPLAPCTVMTRTWLPAASASRFTSAPERRSQCRKPCSDGGCMLRVGQRGVQQLIDRFGRLRPQPGEQPRPAAERPQRLGEQRVGRDVIDACQQRGEERPRRAASAAVRRARSRSASHKAPRRPIASAIRLVVGQAAERAGQQAGERQIVLRQQQRVRQRQQVLHRRLVRSAPADRGPATGTSRDFSARTRARAKSLRRRTSTSTSPGASGRPLLSSITSPAVCAAIHSASVSARCCGADGWPWLCVRHRPGLRLRRVRAPAPAATAPPHRHVRRGRRSASASLAGFDHARGGHRVGEHRDRPGPAPAAVERNDTSSGVRRNSLPAAAHASFAADRASGRTRPRRRPGTSRSTACGRRPRTPCDAVSRAPAPAKNSSVSACAMLPLLRRGVLHLVQQQMVEAAIELVQHPGGARIDAAASEVRPIRSS